MWYNKCIKLLERIHKMRVAVTYEDGQIYQHFGHTQEFKVYDIEDNKVVKAEVYGTNGYGHEALAQLLFGGGVDVLICGGIGGGAQVALAQAGIQVAAGVQGNADAAVQLLLDGKLSFSYEANCHHHEEGHSCGDEGHDCGHDDCGHNCH